MEDWRQTIEEPAEAKESKEWNSDVHHIGKNVDQIEHWKPQSYSQSEYDEFDAFKLKDNHNTTLVEKETCADDVIKIWTEVSKFIVDKMKEGYGTKIAGLGTFTYFQEITEELDCDQKPGQAAKRIPLMILSEFVVRMYDLISPLSESLCTIPTIPLALNAIADKTKFPRKHVDGIMTEVLQSFARALVCDKNLEFPFPNIGKLQICNRKVVFKFYSEFCDQLDFYTGQPVPNQDMFMLNGAMTPLRRHIPTTDYRSIFHLREVRSVHQQDLLAPVQEVQGKFMPMTNQLVTNPDRPTCTLVEDRKKVQPFSLEQLYGPLLNKRCTVSWIKGKRDYLKPGIEPWPSHCYHIVESSVANRPLSRSSAKVSSTTANTVFVSTTPTVGLDSLPIQPYLSK